RLQHFICIGKSDFGTRRSYVSAPAADAHRLSEDFAILVFPLSYRRIVWMMMVAHFLFSFLAI
ncbi:MAG: hypothetical protein J6V72_03720, partial [Kiritimatiellae bacterium]|nr:hypothetical protein [Kiritimatiellia bacterium]